MIACGISLLYLLVSTIQRTVKLRQRKGYTPIDGTASPYGIPKDAIEEEDEAEGADWGGSEAENARLTLHKTVSAAGDSVAEVSRPRGATLLVVVELLAVLGEVGLHLEGLLAWTEGRKGRIASISGICVWGYILLLTSLRLLLPRLRRNPLPQLWNHTAALYCLQWLCTVIEFRTAIIHPRSGVSRALVVIDFSLASLLAIIAITTRKGNRPVLLKYEKNIEPSHEPWASLLSLATFGWVDAIVWKGYWKTLELADVWNILPADEAAHVVASFRQLKRTSKLSWHLLRHFKRLLLFQQVWAFISGLLTFAPTLLLRSILLYIESPEDTPAATAWLFVILLAVVGMLTGVADGLGLWIGRKICIHLRSIMVAEIYAKTLRRRAVATTGTDTSDEKKTLSQESSTKSPFKDKVQSIFRKKKGSTPPTDTAQKEDKDTQMNNGTIINLMSVDSFKVAEVSAYLHFLIPTVPVQLAVAVTLLYRILGWSSLAGIGVMICVLPLNIFFARQFTSVQKGIMAATDGRIHVTNEVLQNIRIIKYFAWEQRFSQNVNDKRRVELRALRSRFIVWGCAVLVWYTVPMIITACSFLIYTTVEKKSLIPSVAFTALSLFSILRYPLDKLAAMMAHILESKVSVDRVERFLNEEETGKYEQLSRTEQDQGEDIAVGFDNATLTWAGKGDAVRENTAFRMIDLNIRFRLGGLNLVVGPTGSGKTSLLMALLGEMTLLSGRVRLPGGSREELKPDPATGFTESVAYCAQQAWLVNDTIKQNIIFASPYDESRYNSVIEACALKRDLEVLDAGDATIVGEKGIVVSGGQKQRVSLARALYCNARYILLDDCLSAVDSHTAQHIFEHCILGPHMLNRTCILVTHNVALCLPQSQYVVVLANGKLTAQGPPDEIMASGLLGGELLSSMPNSKGGTRPQSRARSVTDTAGEASPSATNEHGNGKANGNANGTNGDAKPKQKPQEDVEDANIRTEGKAEGAVGWRVIKLYLASMGPGYFWVLIILANVLENIAQVSTNLWIRSWANSYSTEEVSTMQSLQHPTFSHPASSSDASSFTWLGLSGRSIPFFSTPFRGLSRMSVGQDVNVGYYIGVYVLLGVVYILVALSRLGILFKGSLNASRALHGKLLEATLRAKFKFFDTTPLGQIMNRFSKDMQQIDQEVALVAGGVLQGLLHLIAIITLISVITPGFLIAAFFLSCLYFCIGMFYVRSSRDLKRIESVQRAPLYQQFGETLSGITTIRAYGDEHRFIRDNFQRINTHNRPFIYMWATNRWLALRVDFAGAFVAFFAGVFVVANVGRIDAGAAGLSLTYALTFNENVLWLVRLYADNEQNMNHVERVKKYLELEQEAKASIPEHRPPGNWPSRGTVEFINYSTRYRLDLPQVLQNLNIKIGAEEKVGIVGRTGAGKSSLAMALFRGLEADEGKILIDDVDIGQIGLQDLRENITIVPQDPTLFTGTIRTNLDPFGLFTDEEIFTALRRVHLIGADSSPPTSSTPTPANESLAVPSSADIPSDPTDSTAPDLTKVLTNTGHTNTNPFLSLSSPIAESGTNLSQGQRQLLCLARALLKNPRVLLMDEATASIDYATDAKIQDTLRELKGSTVITIAHRLMTIVDYDKVLVLEKGAVVEFGAPWGLIERDGGVFRGMCEMSGDFEGLREGARKRGRLVDVGGEVEGEG